MKFKTKLKESKFIPKNIECFKFRLSEALSTDAFEIEYDDIEVSGEYGSSSSYEKSIDTTVNYTLVLDKFDIEEALFEILEDLDEYKDMSDEDFTISIENNLDALFDKYYDKLKNYFEDRAAEEASDEFDPYEYEADREAEYWESRFDAMRDEMTD
jgi:hypothetical protein